MTSNLPSLKENALALCNAVRSIPPSIYFHAWQEAALPLLTSPSQTAQTVMKRSYYQVGLMGRQLQQVARQNPEMGRCLCF